jgi:hypothetical protein
MLDLIESNIPESFRWTSVLANMAIIAIPQRPKIKKRQQCYEDLRTRCTAHDVISSILKTLCSSPNSAEDMGWGGRIKK